MDILLDTQAVIWYIEDEVSLTQKARNTIRDADFAYVSVVSFYEIAIKLAVGKDVGINRTLSKQHLNQVFFGFLSRPTTLTLILGFLFSSTTEIHGPTLRFDRMLLATAVADGLTIVSSDHNFPLYTDVVSTVW